MSRRLVESPANQLVKRVVRLRERRERARSGLFLIEGEREVGRAMSAGVQLSQLLFCPSHAGRNLEDLLRRAEELGAEPIELSSTAFEKVSMREGPDGVLAVARSWRGELQGLSTPEDALLLVLEGVAKPGNLGALLRTADAVAAHAVLVCGSGTDPFNPNVVRASMGSLFALPVAVASSREVREFLKSRSIPCVAAAPGGEVEYWDADLRGPVAVVLGAEDRGLEREWLEECRTRVGIPMKGSADSLNVATAGALLLFEALRQRRRVAH